MIKNRNYSETFYLLQRRVFSLYSAKMHMDLNDLFFAYLLLSREIYSAHMEQEITEEEFEKISAYLMVAFEACISRQIIPMQRVL